MLKNVRILAILEGISYLAFALTMPLKYIFNMPLPNKIVGNIHGVLFIAFCVLVVLAAKQFKWENKKTFILLLSSLIPFGTFWTEKRYLRIETN